MAPILTLRCFRPSGVLTWTPEDLTRHIIGFGCTGSGKTSGFINPALQQLIAARADEPEKRLGLLVLDGKGDDDTVAKIRGYARQAGRQRDVVVLGTHGADSYYELFGGLERADQTQMDQIEGYARRLLAGTQDFGESNYFWSETRNGLVNLAVTLLLASGAPPSFEAAVEFLQSLWFSGDDKLVVEPRLQFVRRLLAGPGLSAATRRRLELALNEVQNWRQLEARTKEILKSTLASVLRPLVASAARRLFDASHPASFRARDVLDGKIMIVSVDPTQPDQARLIFRLVRQDFYAAMQSRGVVRPEKERLAGLIADELHLSAMAEDVTALSVIRSQGAFALAASQSLNSLDEVLGRRGRDALLANFCTMFFFQARENALDELAFLALGYKGQHPGAADGTHPGGVQFLQVADLAEPRPVCPPGTLARLRQHQIFARLPDGSVTEAPVSLEPLFVDSPDSPNPKREPAPRDDLAVAVQKLREESALQEAPAAPTFLMYMHNRGHRLHLTPNVLGAAWQVCVPTQRHSALLAKARGFHVGGLTQLPGCWLLGLLAWLRRHPTLAPAVLQVTIDCGVLWPTLDAAWTNWGDGPESIPESINLALYPCLWRALKPRHLFEIASQRPDLRAELPQPSTPGKTP